MKSILSFSNKLVSSFFLIFFIFLFSCGNQTNEVVDSSAPQSIIPEYKSIQKIAAASNLITPEENEQLLTQGIRDVFEGNTSIDTFLKNYSTKVGLEDCPKISQSQYNLIAGVQEDVEVFLQIKGVFNASTIAEILNNHSSEQYSENFYQTVSNVACAAVAGRYPHVDYKQFNEDEGWLLSCLVAFYNNVVYFYSPYTTCFSSQKTEDDCLEEYQENYNEACTLNGVAVLVATVGVAAAAGTGGLSLVASAMAVGYQLWAFKKAIDKAYKIYIKCLDQLEDVNILEYNNGINKDKVKLPNNPFGITEKEFDEQIALLIYNYL